jgi:TRAP-type transport system periplasmic protein
MKHRVVLFAVASLGCLLVASVGHAAAPIKLKFAMYFPPSHKNAVLYQQFCDEIKKRTNGRVEIAYYPGGTLATHPKVYQSVLTGVADIGLANLGTTRGRFPVSEVNDLPLGFPSAWVASHAANDFYHKFPLKEWEKVHLFYLHACGPLLVITGRTPVKKLEDMRGVKLRAVGRFADAVQALGGTAVPIDMTEFYESANKGVVEGTYCPMEVVTGFKLGEILKYALAPLQIAGVGTFYLVMNQEKWNSLPPDIKKIFNDVVAEWFEKQAASWNDIDIEALENFKKTGGQFIFLSDEEAVRWKKAVQPVISDYVKDMEAKGHKKAEIEGYIQYIRERIEYWKKREKELKVATPFP